MENKTYIPPGFLRWIHHRLTIYENCFAFSRDIEIEYTAVCKDRNRLYAFCWLLWITLQVLFSYSMFYIKWRFIMFKNHIKITLRSMQRHKVFSFINVAGLAIGIACMLIIMLWVRYETSFDRFFEKSDHIYRVASESRSADNFTKMVVTPPPLAPALLDTFPEIEKACRLSRGGGKKLFSYNDKHFLESYYPVDASFLEIFSLDLKQGNTKTAMEDPDSILLSETMAQKLFGNQDPINKIVLFDQKTEFKVTGVFKNIPSNSHLIFNIFMPFETWGKIFNEPLDHWLYWSFYTYIQLNPSVDPEKLEAKLPAFMAQHDLPKAHPFLQPITSIHLHSHFSGEISNNTHVSTLYLFGAVAFLILLIGCINYINLTTARSSIRAKEIGARKVIGAHRLQLAGQFLCESMIIALIAFGFALVLAHLFIPLFNSIAGLALSFSQAALLQLFPIFLALILLVGMIGGSYPALVLSSFQPAKFLKNGILHERKKPRLRNGLVILQFSVTLILITATLLINSQMEYIRNKDLGFNKNHIVVVPLQDPLIKQNAGSLITELKRNPRILYASATMHLPNEVGATTAASWPGKDSDLKITIKASEADYDFAELYGVNIIQGRNFSRDFPSDESGAFLINETARALLGEHFRLGMDFDHWRGKGKIVGVFQDYHQNSLHEKIQPLYIFLNPGKGHFLSIKIQSENIAQTIGYIKDTVVKLSPRYPFEFQFLDQQFFSVYSQEQKKKKMLTVFSIIAVIIAGMGVFGLTTFLAQQKRKEIGIRKVLGASVPNIVSLLSIQLVRLVIFANLIGWPVAYYIMNKWLENYAYRTHINPWIFLAAGLLTLLFSLATLSFQAVKAATSNPVESLRYE